MRYSELAIVEQQLNEYRSLAKMASSVKSRLGPTASMRARGRTEREIQRVVDAAHSNYRKWLSQLGLRPEHSFEAVRRSSTIDNWDDEISVLDNYLSQRRMPHQVYELDSEGNVDDSNLKNVSEAYGKNWKEAIRQSVTAYMQSRAPRTTEPPLAASVRQSAMATPGAETPPPRTSDRSDQAGARGQASTQSGSDQPSAPADDQSEPAQQLAQPATDSAEDDEPLGTTQSNDSEDKKDAGGIQGQILGTSINHDNDHHLTAINPTTTTRRRPGSLRARPSSATMDPVDRARARNLDVPTYLRSTSRQDLGHSGRRS